jgi:hypothetical protein
MTKEKELLDNYLKGWCDGKREGQNSQKEKPSDSEIKEMIFDAKQEQKQKDLEMIEKHIIEDDYMGIDTKQSLKELTQKIKEMK